MCLDNDQPGYDALWGKIMPDGKREDGAVEKLTKLSSNPVKVLKWPANKSDPDELTREEIITMINSSGVITKINV